jgi:hypothetical protein
MPSAKSHINFYDFKIIFDQAIVTGLLSTDNINDAIDQISSQITKTSNFVFKKSFAVERPMAKVLAVHSITIICPTCKASNYIPDFSAVCSDKYGFMQIFCEKCQEKYYLNKEMFS